MGKKVSSNLDALTAFRGVAAWWVVLYHVKEYINIPNINGIVSLGYLAVDFFFVLSGFIISYAYYEKLTKFSNINIFKFYLKRLSRIYPLHLLVLLIYCVIPIIFFICDKNLPADGKYDLGYLLLSFFLVQNWGWESTLAWNVPAWSISTEFFVYIIFPFMALSLVNVKTKAGVFAVFLVGVLGIPVVFIMNGTMNIGESIAKLGLFRCAFEFLVGVCCYRFFSMGYKLNPSLSVFLFLLGIVLFLLPPLLIDKSMTLLLVPVSSALIIYATLYLPQKYIRLVSSVWILYLGEMSYSTYMLHYVVLDVFKLATPSSHYINFWWVVFYIFCLFLASSVSFKYIENGARKWLNAKIDRAFGGSSPR